MTWQLWLEAYFLTQLIEVPIWFIATQRLPLRDRILIALGASTITHPIVWFAFPWDTAGFLPTLLAAESFAIAVEALFAMSFKLRNPWLWSILANSTSAGIGLILSAVFSQ